MTKLTHVIKRDGSIVPFTPERIANAIYRAAVAVDGRDKERAESLAAQVVAALEEVVPEGKYPTIETIQDTARQSGISLWQAACSGGAGRSAAAVGRFVQLIESMRAQTQALAMPEMFRVMLDLSGLIEHYRADKEGEDRVANLEELVNAAVDFVAEDENDLIAFLSHASLEAGEHQAGAGEAAIQLMSVHAV